MGCEVGKDVGNKVGRYELPRGRNCVSSYMKDIAESDSEIDNESLTIL